MNINCCLLYTSDAADDMQCVDLGGRRIIKKTHYLMSLHDLGLLILLLSPGMILSILLLITFAEGG